MVTTLHDLADELERLCKRSEAERDRGLVVSAQFSDCDIAALVRANLPAILRALRGEPDAAEVERAAVALGKALAEAGIPNAERDNWGHEARIVIRAARSRP